MTAVGIVPARWRSSRFPGKPLVEIAGVSMLQRVVEGTRRAKSLRDVLVATDDERIAEACAGFGAPVVMTGTHHPSGTDRIAEAARDLSDAVVVNVQGDEPLIEGFVIDAAVAALADSGDTQVATVAHPLDPDDATALADPNRVKVVLDRFGHALYFSRAPIPARRAGAPAAEVLQHVGLYVYRREFLLRWADLAPTPLEQTEALEQLRVLENGHRIQVARIEGWQSVSVDTPADVPRVEAELARRAALAAGD